MGEEIKKQAVELTDEEMDKVVGGKSAVLSTTYINSVAHVDVQTCSEQTDPRVFREFLKTGGKCDKFIWRASMDNSPDSCQTCANHQGVVKDQSMESVADLYRQLCYSIFIY